MSQFATPTIAGATRSDDYIDTYASLFRIGSSSTDFTLVFGSLDDRGFNNVQSLDRVAVHISPQMLKIMSLQLAANLKAYEDVLGTINLSRNVMHALDGTYQAVFDQLTLWNK